MYLVLSYLSNDMDISFRRKKKDIYYFIKLKDDPSSNQEEVFFYDAEVYEFEFLEEKMERPKMRRDS